MTYKFELFLVIPKKKKKNKAHKYKIIRTLFSFNFIYSLRYIYDYVFL